MKIFVYNSIIELNMSIWLKEFLFLSSSTYPSSYSQRMTIQMKGFFFIVLLKSHMSHNVPALHSREVGCMSIEGFLFFLFIHSSQLVVAPILSYFPINPHVPLIFLYSFYTYTWEPYGKNSDENFESFITLAVYVVHFDQLFSFGFLSFLFSCVAE